MKNDYLFVKQEEIFTPSFIQTKDTIYGNAKFVTKKDFEELDSKSKKNPTNFINLLTAYAIVAPNDTTSEKKIYHFEKGLPIKMGIDLPNALIVGPSGIGKTSMFNIPLLFDSVRKGNSNVMVVTGGSNAINQACQVIQKAGGDTPIIFDLSKNFPYDPLNDLDSERKIAMFWDTVVKIIASSCRDDSAWVYNQVIENLIDLSKRIKTRNLTICDLRRIIISGNYDNILLKKMDGPLASFARSLKNENRNSDTAQNTMREVTTWIDFHNVSFSHPSFSWLKFVENGGNVIINIPGSLNSVLKPYLTGIISNLVNVFDEISNSADTGSIPYKTIINIDELAICPLQAFTDLLHVNRKQGWCVAAGVQSIGQIEAIFKGNANSLLAGFQTKLAISPDPFSAKYFSELSGKASMISPEVIKVDGEFIIGERGTIVPRNLFLDTDINSPTPHPILGAPVLVISPPLVYQAYLSSIYQHGGFQFSNSIDYKFKKTKQTFSIILRKGSCNPSKLDGILGFLIYTRKIDVNIAKELLSSTCKQSIVLFSTTSRKLAIQTKIMIMACAGGIESRIRIRKV